MTRTFHTTIDERRILLVVSSHWDPGEPGSLSVPPTWEIDNLEVYDPITGHDLTTNYAYETLEEIANAP